MRNSIRVYVLLILLVILLLCPKAFAVENEIESDIVITCDNYFEYREKLLNEKTGNINIDSVPKLFNSPGTPGSNENIIDYVKSEINKCNTEISIIDYALSENEVLQLIEKIWLNEEIFNVNAIGYSYLENAGQRTGVSLIVTYSLTKDETDLYWSEIETTTEEYLNGINNSWSDLEKIIYTHDFLCKKCIYGNPNILISHTLAAALVTNNPVCDGYSKAFIYLTNKIGIESSLVTSNSMNHAWNQVKLNDKWYQLDVTWDDPVRPTNYCDGYYQYFLSSDANFENVGMGHNSWVASEVATDTTFDTAFWTILKNLMIYHENEWYYTIENYKTIYSISFRNNQIENVHSNSVAISDIINWKLGITTDNKYLYLSGNTTIYRTNFDGTSLIEFYRISNPNKIIFGVEIRDGNFYYDTTDIVGGSTSTNTRVTNPINVIINLNQTNLDLAVAEETDLSVLSLQPTELCINDGIVWRSEDETIVTVDENGHVTAIGEGQTKITAILENIAKAECTVTVENVIPEESTLLNLESDEFSKVTVESDAFLIFDEDKKIEDVITASNFPALNNGYTIQILDNNLNEKESNQNIGSRDCIKILDAHNTVILSYTAVVIGDVTGNGHVKIYDAFTILIDAVNQESSYNDIDILIRDYNNDGRITIYDAFQFLMLAIS